MKPPETAVMLARIANDHARLAMTSSGEQSIFYRRAAKAYRTASKQAARVPRPGKGGF